MNDFTKQIVFKIVVMIIVIAAAYFLVLAPILRRLGIIQTKDDKIRDEKAKTMATSTDSPWSPTYWKNKPGAKLITKAETITMADKIDDAIGTFYDDENVVYGVLRQLKAKTQLSWLADIFYQRHEMDMFTLLNRNFGDEEMDVIIGIADSLQ